MTTGPSIARLCALFFCINVSPAKVVLQQNNGAPSSDEEDDITQLQAVENKLLTHDPNFGIEQTHAALSSQRSAFMSAFRPQYIDGDVEGMHASSILDTLVIWQLTALHRRSCADPPEYRTLARV